METTVGSVEQHPITRTLRKELPGLWECGGVFGNSGVGAVITRNDGQKPRAAYVPRNNRQGSGEHALVVVRPGMYVIEARHKKGDFQVYVSKIRRVKREVAEAVITHIFDADRWQPAMPKKLAEAISAAKEKAKDEAHSAPSYVDLS